MGLINKYKQNLLGKLFLYVLEQPGDSPPPPYCIARVTSLYEGGAYCSIISTNIFSLVVQWFFEGSLMDENSRIIENVNINYLELFRKLEDEKEYNKLIVSPGIRCKRK